MTWRYTKPRPRKARKELRAVARPQEGVAPSPRTASLNSPGGSSQQVTPGVFSLTDEQRAAARAAARLALKDPPPRLRRGEFPPADRVQALVDEGYTDRRLGDLYNRSEKWGRSARERYGIAPKPREPADYPSAVEMVALVAEGLSDPEIGARYGRDVAWAARARRAHGIKAALGPGRRPKALPVQRAAPPVVEPPPVVAIAPQPKSRSELQAERYAAFFAEHGPYQSFTEAQIARFERRWATAHPTRAPVIDIAPALYGDPAPGRAA